MTKKQRLRNKADKLFKELILKLHPICESCNEKQSNTAHHFFPRSLYGHLRYNIFNGIGICQTCHFFHHHRGDPTIHNNIIRKRGKKWLNKLEKLAKKRPIYSLQTLKYYQDTLKRLNNS